MLHECQLALPATQSLSKRVCQGGACLRERLEDGEEDEGEDGEADGEGDVSRFMFMFTFTLRE